MLQKMKKKAPQVRGKKPRQLAGRALRPTHAGGDAIVREHEPLDPQNRGDHHHDGAESVADESRRIGAEIHESRGVDSGRSTSGCHADSHKGEGKDLANVHGVFPCFFVVDKLCGLHCLCLNGARNYRTSP